MANLRIAPLNFHDEATVTSDNELASLPGSYTQSIHRGLVYRSANATTPFVALRGTFAADRRVNCFALFRHNLYGAQVTLQLYSDASWTTSVYSSGALAAATLVAGAYDWGYDPAAGGSSKFDPLIGEAPFELWFAEQTIRSYKLTVSGTLGAAYAEIGRAFLGRYLEFTSNPRQGLGLGWETNSSQVRTLGGSVPTNDREMWRTLNFELGSLREAQRPTLLDFQRKCGLTRDLLVSVHPADGTRKARDYLLDAKFANLDAITRSNVWSGARIALKEC